MNKFCFYWNPLTRVGFGAWIDKPFVAVLEDNFAGCFDGQAEAQNSLSKTPGGIVIERGQLFI